MAGKSVYVYKESFKGKVQHCQLPYYCLINELLSWCKAATSINPLDQSFRL